MNYEDLDSVVTYKSALSVSDASTQLLESLKLAGFTIFLSLDQTQEAKNVNLELRPTHVIMFGMPEQGTLLMNKHPTLSFVLPVKVVITENEAGETTIVHANYDDIAKEHSVDTVLFPRLSALINKTLVGI